MRVIREAARHLRRPPRAVKTVELAETVCTKRDYSGLEFS